MYVVFGVVYVQPVLICRALFCIVCRVLWKVVARFGAQAGPAYSKTERMYCLYISVKVSLCCPKSVPVSVRILLNRFVHFCSMSCMWSWSLMKCRRWLQRFLWNVCVGYLWYLVLVVVCDDVLLCSWWGGWLWTSLLPLLVRSCQTRSVVCISSFVVVLWRWGCHCVWIWLWSHLHMTLCLCWRV